MKVRQSAKMGAGLGAAVLALGALSALAGQGKAAPARIETSQGYWVEELATGLKFPTSIAWLPNGDALIAERQGGLRLFSKGKVDPAPIQGLPSSFQNSLNGLKDVVLDPQFASNGVVYILMSQGSYDAHYASVFRARLQGHALTEVKQIFRSKDTIGGPSQIAGRMILLKDGTLLFAVTEDNYHKRFAQDPASHIGKLLRINRDGTVPADNPFQGKPGYLPEIWTLGHRTPLGLYQEADTGNVYETEAGPKGGDEFNLIKPGHNYGWPNVTWGFDYSSSLAGPLQTSAGTDQPLLVWTPSVTPSGVTKYAGKTYPFWDGSYFVGTLTARAMERLKIEGGRVVLRERMLFDLGERIREVSVGPDGRLYILTDNSNGRVLRLDPGAASGAQLARVAHKLPPAAAGSGGGLDLRLGDPVKGEAAFKDRCAACHSVGARIKGGDIGPDLETAYGRQAGALPGYSYSPAIAKLPQTWDYVALDSFLANPEAYAAGTKMTSPPVDDRSVRMDIAAYLNRTAGLGGATFGGPNTVNAPRPTAPAVP